MSLFEEDSAITEVRKNRAELLAEFDGDIKKLIEYVDSQRSVFEAAGWRYETEAELEARKAWQRKRQEAEQSRIAAMLYNTAIHVCGRP